MCLGAFYRFLRNTADSFSKSTNTKFIDQEHKKELGTLNFRWDKKYLYWGVTAICVIIVGFFVFAAIFKFQGMLSVIHFLFRMLTPIWYGFAIAYLLTPLVNKLDRIQIKTYLKQAKRQQQAQKVARVISVIISILLLLGIIAGLLLMLIPQLITNIIVFYENIELYFSQLQSGVAQLFGENHRLALYVDQFLHWSRETVQRWFSTDLVPQMQNMLVHITSAVWSIVGVFTDVIIGIIVSIYFLYSKEKFCAQGKKVTYALLNRRHSDVVIKNARYAHRVFGGFITGKLIDSAIVGGICFVVMTIFHFPYPTLISVIITITNLIPFFGPYIGAIPSAFLILLVDPFQALYFCIFILILQQVDGNIIAPRILGETTGLTGFWVIFAVILFGGTLGFVGLVIGVPAFAVIYTWMSNWVVHRLKNKQMPDETKAYYLPGCYRTMTEEEKMAFDQAESERALQAYQKATKKTWVQKVKKWWKLRKYR